MHQAKGLQFTARVGELPENVFSVVGFELTEGLSELVHGRLKMASNLPTLAAADALEQWLELIIWQDGTAIRRFTGVVSEFVRGGSSRRPAVFRLRYEQRVRAAAVVMKDYTFHNPAYALMQEHTASSLQHRDDYQHYEYPGRFKTDASGKRFTEAKLDALRNDASIASGESNRADFTCGAKVQLTHHHNEKLNQDWLITHVAHSGSQPQALEEAGAKPTTYHNRFSAVPGNINWRPRCTHRPLMDGPQIAIVTGPDGEEIHCDQHGRVQVRFPWDQHSRTGQAESSESSGAQSSALRPVGSGAWFCFTGAHYSGATNFNKGRANRIRTAMCTLG